MPKIIRTDNFGRSGVSPGFDELVVAVETSMDVATKNAKTLNLMGNLDDEFFYFATEDNYKLLKYEDEATMGNT